LNTFIEQALVKPTLVKPTLVKSTLAKRSGAAIYHQVQAERYFVVFR